jgi:TP53 regulating kinase-like protein
MFFVASMLRETNHRRRRTETQDLYVLERSFRSAHPLDGDELLESLLSSYKTCSKKWCSTMNRLADVRLRGRKRSMVG